MLQPLAVRHEPIQSSPALDLAAALDLLKQVLERNAPTRFPVKAGEGWVFLDLKKVTHFEVSREVVYAWAGQKFRTSWTRLIEVEAAFPHEPFQRIQRHLLLRPDVVLGMKMTEGGRAEVRIAGGMDLEVTRGAVPKLKQSLGLT
jgi:two-component system LytT family response regulator/two-component system response regulator AlgR